MKKNLPLIILFCFYLNIQQVFSQSTVSTLAGATTQGYVDGAGTAARFFDPTGLAVDGSGNIIVADEGNQVIRKITAAGVVTTIAGSGSAGSTDGTGTAASFNVPTGVTIDGTGNIYVCDYYNRRIRKIATGAVVTTLAGNGSTGSADGTGTAATFNFPYYVAVDASGNVFVSDYHNHKIRKVTSAGVVTTVAGTGTAGAINGTGTSASFNLPQGIAVDASGNIYVADSGNNLIRKITSTGVVTTVAGSGTAGSANGTGTSANFNNPAGLTVSATTGYLYVTDFNNNLIRAISPAGVVTTLAGSGSNGSTNGVGTSATFNGPLGITVDAAEIVYVADYNNHMIRKITGSLATATVELTNVSGMQIFPVPASDQLVISLTLKSEGNLHVDLINTSGIVVAGTTAGNYAAGDQELSLSVINLPAGIYVAKVYSNNQMSCQKVIIAR